MTEGIKEITVEFISTERKGRTTSPANWNQYSSNMTTVTFEPFDDETLGLDNWTSVCNGSCGNGTDVNDTSTAGHNPHHWIMGTAKDMRYATAGVAVLGLIGNTLAIFVLCHRRMWCSTAYLLVILAIYDDVILLLHIYRVFDQSSLTPFVRIFQTVAFGPVVWTATTGTIYMTLMVTVERFVAVTAPLRSRIIFSLRAAKWISLGVLLGSVAYNTPHWFAFNYRDIPRPVSEFGKSRAYVTVYKQHVQLAFMYCLPWVTMVVLNLLLIRTVRSKRAFRETGRSTSGGPRDLGARLTLPVIAVTFVFFLAYPFLAIEDSLCYAFGCDHKLILTFKIVSEIAKVFNSTANFLFYCFFGRRFRRTFFYMAVSWRSRVSRVVTSRSADFRYSVTDGSSTMIKLEKRAHNGSSNGSVVK